MPPKDPYYSDKNRKKEKKDEDASYLSFTTHRETGTFVPSLHVIPTSPLSDQCVRERSFIIVLCMQDVVLCSSALLTDHKLEMNFVN